jgi:formate--tetrahydrofolate ligase
VATKTALKLADYVVTEAGFGADLGAEKFIDIKCRLAHLQPDVVVIVATIRALKYHGGADLTALNAEKLNYLTIGINNLKKHIHNLREEFGLPVVVAINHFTQDTVAEVATVQAAVKALGLTACVCTHWADGASGATDLANTVVQTLTHATVQTGAGFKYLYPDTMPLRQKLHTLATRMYGASAVAYSAEAEQQLNALETDYAHLPICVAKTQYSLSCDAQLRNCPTGHVLTVRAFRLARGAGFIVAICGDIMTMPGLPKVPASTRIAVNSAGDMTGLS